MEGGMHDTSLDRASTQLLDGSGGGQVCTTMQLSSARTVVRALPYLDVEGETSHLFIPYQYKGRFKSPDWMLWNFLRLSRVTAMS